MYDMTNAKKVGALGDLAPDAMKAFAAVIHAAHFVGK